jgi:hypothetical protein
LCNGNSPSAILFHSLVAVASYCLSFDGRFLHCCPILSVTAFGHVMGLTACARWHALPFLSVSSATGPRDCLRCGCASSCHWSPPSFHAFLLAMMTTMMLLFTIGVLHQFDVVVVVVLGMMATMIMIMMRMTSAYLSWTTATDRASTVTLRLPTHFIYHHHHSSHRKVHSCRARDGRISPQLSRLCCNRRTYTGGYRSILLGSTSSPSSI